MAIIRGYGAIFNRIVRTAEVSAFVVTKNTFSLAGRSVGFCFDHEESRRYAATNNRSMSVWHDAWGLAFECEVKDEGLINLVRRGECIEASCYYHPISHRDGTFNGEPVKFFDRATVSEISVVSRGGCPDTAIWLAETPENDMTDHQRFSARMWRMGRAQNSRRRGFAGQGSVIPVSNRLILASAPRTTAVPASVVALLNDPGNRAFWAESSRLRAELHGRGNSTHSAPQMRALVRSI
ncbi:MAG: hypothetical protein BGN83_19780 [Rhizobium sp. 63-7]|nr:MAG: hypothetical protein BGN83_19780 [Rhizobium sp. 63-7]